MHCPTRGSSRSWVGVGMAGFSSEYSRIAGAGVLSILASTPLSCNCPGCFFRPGAGPALVFSQGRRSDRFRWGVGEGDAKAHVAVPERGFFPVSERRAAVLALRGPGPAPLHLG